MRVKTAGTPGFCTTDQHNTIWLCQTPVKYTQTWCEWSRKRMRNNLSMQVDILHRRWCIKLDVTGNDVVWNGLTCWPPGKHCCSGISPVLQFWPTELSGIWSSCAFFLSFFFNVLLPGTSCSDGFIHQLKTVWTRIHSPSFELAWLFQHTRELISRN